jgi:serine/threonine protein kinase
MSNIDIRGTPGYISPELIITFYINDNKKYDKIMNDINNDIKPILNSFKDSKIILDFDKTNIQLYNKIMNEYKNKTILNKFFGSDENKYNGYLQKGDIFAFGITIYIFINNYMDYFKNDYKLFDLLRNMIKIDPESRFNIVQCLNDPYFL